MASRSRGRRGSRRGGAGALDSVKSTISSIARLAPPGSLGYYAVAALILVGLMYTAYWLRMLPWSNYEAVYKLALSTGIEDKIARYSFIHANDPWIEYWLANYLHAHGLGSWTSLTRDNPATHIFWYPWGRDFTRSEYPLMPMLGSLGDPLRTTMLLPVYAGVVLVAVAFLLLLYEYGLAAAVAGSLPLAVMYASASRTFAGFAEKEGFTMPLVAASLLLLSIALSRRRLGAAIASGVVGGLVAMSWGGYPIIGLAYLATALILPLGVRGRESVEYLRYVLAAAASYAVLVLVLYALRLGKIAPGVPIAAAAGVALTMIVVDMLYGRLEEEVRRRGLTVAKAYLSYLVLVVLGGLLVAAEIGLGGRYLFTILWPLRDLGLVKFARIQETVAEMTGITRPGVTGQIISGMGVMFFLIPVLGLYGLYMVLRGREPRLTPLVVAGLGLFYGLLGMVYMEQSAAVAGTLMVGAVVGAMTAPRGAEEKPRARRTRPHSSELEEVKRAVTVFILLAIIVGSAVSASHTEKRLSSTIASITGFSRNAVDFSWLTLLQHLSGMSNDTVVVSWWDYGYWISVGSGKPTLADGATFNTTQIELLARFFTGTEEEANNILKMLNLPPNNTLIVIHDLAVYNPRSGTFQYTGSIDIPKSWAMHHIAARDDKFNRLVDAVRRRAAQEIVDIVNETTIYRMFAAAPYYVNMVGLVAPPAYASLVNTTTMKINVVSMFGVAMPRFHMKHFQPYMVILAPLLTSDGKIVVAGNNVYQFHVIVVYKWLG